MLTARPTPADEARVPHRAVWRAAGGGAGERGVVARAALAAMERALAAGRLPILCGGTGLYLAALTQGIAEIPRAGRRRRAAEARALLAQEGAGGAACAAGEGRPGDGGRAAAERRPAAGARLGGVARHRARAGGVAGASPARRAPWRFRLMPARSAAGRRCGRRSRRGSTRCWRRARWRRCAALLALGLDPALPAMRAHGVPELARLSARRADAAGGGGSGRLLATGQYLKRQATWFRHREHR